MERAKTLDGFGEMFLNIVLAPVAIAVMMAAGILTVLFSPFALLCRRIGSRPAEPGCPGRAGDEMDVGDIGGDDSRVG